ncbi:MULTISPECIES: YhgE/Pip domain-containing protein [Pseudonocardia]|uniref:Chromosome partition protein Smc n=2 Tax=Pseudonocardia TaxID=1847 RepID=A0A1Y2MXR9_PSEAH|nr:MULTISPECIES: YhgE/Pip domain-containing protein [Pseudonocardia]OSY39438.1 Chromosome partition protein Smc [Pseudonocardia autotrophica]TDN75324.1 putative membrane protein [Pseudonocardia autotrophica]BBF99270.1 ABC transporter [Pseudonocardia autotrophica]GEC24816.1 ABC transporter [Pseudonocardia saturnea]
MSAIRMAISELRRITAGRLPVLAVLALLLIPMLYAGFYLYANGDPYSRLDRVPAALVVEDAGGTDADGNPQNVGEQVATDLMESGSFDFHRVGAAEADRGVRDNEYTFALTVTRDFTAALHSSADLTPRQGVLVLTTNDANNYLVRTIADTLTGRVRDSVAQQVGTEAADNFLTGFSTIYTKTQEAANGAGELADGAGRAHDGARELAAGADQLASGQRQLLGGAQQLAGGAGELSSGAGTLAGGAGTAAAGADRLNSGAGELATGLGTLRDATAQLPAQARELADGARQVADGNAQVAEAGDRVAQESARLAAQLDAADGTIADGLRARGFTEEQVTQALAALAEAKQPLEQGNARVQEVSGRLDQLGSGARQVADGAERLAVAAPQLGSGIGSAADGAGALRDGAAELSGGVRALSDGATRLSTGADALATGAGRLVDGERTAVEGTDRLADGAHRLDTGTGELATGAGTLRDGLFDGLGQIPNPSPDVRAATAQNIGDPVATRDVAHSRADTYGAGLAPFFMALATWIGGYVLFLLLQPLSRRAIAAGQSPLRVALGGWIPAGLLGVVQVTGMYVVVSAVLGIVPAHPLGTLAFLWLVSMTFTAIVHALNALLGAVGQFLGLVLMVLQLVSAGGTFPWQTIPEPLYPMHLLMPMGYAVDALRHLMYGGELTGVVGTAVPVLAAWFLISVLLATLAAHRQRVWRPSTVKPELVL